MRLALTVRRHVAQGVAMQKDVFEKVLKRKVSQITFSGHRVNDDYSLNKRKAIMAVVLSAFDEAADGRLAN